MLKVIRLVAWRYKLVTIIVKSRRCSLPKLEKEFLGAIIVDVTSQGDRPWVKFSPFYPHSGIPVPFLSGNKSQTVEGVWQGLKVFESTGIDLSVMRITNMKGIKRTVRKYGKCLGHRANLDGKNLLNYSEARRLIYLPTYLWVLENRLTDSLAQLKQIADNNTVILLDYETNGDVANLSKPLSHAQLIKMYVEDNYPT